MAQDRAPRQLLARIDALEARLSALAHRPLPAALTEPDPESEERWEPGQVWAHIAEFVPYWTGEARRVMAGRGAGPHPFGRIKSDPGRIAGIERERHTSPAELMTGIRAAFEEVRALATELDGAAAARVGVHPTVGQFTVPDILDRFIASHLEEHAEQLEKLARP